MFTKNLQRLVVQRNSQMAMTATRSFASQGVLTWELKDHLRKLGITNPNIVQNPT